MSGTIRPGLVTRVSYWPTGCSPDHPEASGFQVDVEWCGVQQGGSRSRGGYRVSQRGAQLSRAGNWSWSVRPHQQWQHRWSTLEEAQAWASRVVDDVQVNGRTWAQWEEHLAERKAPAEA